MSTLTEVNPNLKALTDAGVSVWLDQLGRSLVSGGELKRLIAQESLRGVTSNPSIFEKSILGSSDYDAEIESLARAGASAKEIYDHLTIADVQGAADILAPVHNETGGRDGFVSLEVAPDLARDGEQTITAARHYWKAVDRPNLMIKIPGTPEGLSAIETAISEGINVNVTLLFAVEAYEAVIEAYLAGLERRHADGKPLAVHSVASFFVSRVDTMVDKQLGEAHPDLHGTAALANARAAYRLFKERFSGERWERLAAAGAVVQRPLWASTGVKNPAYSDTLYVDQLVGPDTVNTMPLATLNAVADHGHAIPNSAEDDPTAVLDALASAGIDMKAVTEQLLADGITQFEEAMDGLLAGIDSARQAAITGRPATIEASLPDELVEVVAAQVNKAVSEQVAQRIWKRDPSLWGGPDVPEIENRLGWLTVCDRMLEQLADLKALARELTDAGYTDAILLGMGGSSLGPEVIRRSYGTCEGGLRLQVLDSTHPDAITAISAEVDLARTIFIVSSKSGGTIETLSHYRHFRASAGPEQFIVVTDPGSPLADLAETDGLRRTFLNPPDIGGRYSVLSYFGLVPAAIAGVPIEELIKTAQAGEQAASQVNGSADNPGLWLGATVGALANHGRDKLTFIVSDPIASFGLWVEQLVAESTGKQGKGILPVADEPLGDPAAYGDDRVFVYLRDADAPSEELDARVKALAAAGQPTITLATHGADDLGRLFFIAEFAVAVAGWALQINPFDQPNVQEAKDNTAKVLDSGSVPAIDAADDERLVALLRETPPHYVAILAYLAFDADVDAAVLELRETIRAKTQMATTFGYGPRFQHSTGQEHKGGAPVGRFLQLTDTPSASVAIPGEPYDFGTLIASQAAGDLETLHAHNLAAERVVLDAPAAEAIRALSARIGRLL
ncbi:bifunctional transaldolase/phosoglucose isomerase [Conexibacter sp. DBS9H8]|uniref:bifunctional transaldolase/phosoglucose isomerase n=1 Tax=Conexibacter sp. DBS9H8 TaxID=2937801 RepID=UPI00200D71C6|nr:bifunctional transaldolase/phosoglucose isomerase [Conexibacter sp. DBS9H8]